MALSMLTRKFESNEFFYEKINPHLKYQEDTPDNTVIDTMSQMALRQMIEMAYQEGKKDMLDEVADAFNPNVPFAYTMDKLYASLIKS